MQRIQNFNIEKILIDFLHIMKLQLSGLYIHSIIMKTIYKFVHDDKIQNTLMRNSLLFSYSLW